MLLVIFGAGASYDSAPSKHPHASHYQKLPNRPPLASELFSDRQLFGEIMNKYPQCLAIIPQLRKPFGHRTVESELQQLQSEVSAYPERGQQLAAIRYYLQHILWVTGEKWLSEIHNVNNYLTLIDRIKSRRAQGERVCFITFNYDFLLDQALRFAGYPFNELSAYIARDLMLIKLHGSVNWGRSVNSHIQDDLLNITREGLAQHLITYYSQLEISKEWLVIGEYPPAPRKKKAVVPALAIPVESKLTFECPSEHVNALKAFIPEVRKILIIGWRATELPFLTLLKEGLGAARPWIKIINGSPKESEETLKRIERAGIHVRDVGTEAAESTFTDFITTRGEDKFLALK